MSFNDRAILNPTQIINQTDHSTVILVIPRENQFGQIWKSKILYLYPSIIWWTVSTDRTSGLSSLPLILSKNALASFTLVSSRAFRRSERNFSRAWALKLSCLKIEVNLKFYLASTWTFFRICFILPLKGIVLGWLEFWLRENGFSSSPVGGN